MIHVESSTKKCKNSNVTRKTICPPLSDIFKRGPMMAIHYISSHQRKVIGGQKTRASFLSLARSKLSCVGRITGHVTTDMTPILNNTIHVLLQSHPNISCCSITRTWVNSVRFILHIYILKGDNSFIAKMLSKIICGHLILIRTFDM